MAVSSLVALSFSLNAQTETSAWRHIGNSAIDVGLASVATGPVDRVWYSDDGQHLFAKTHSGRIFETDDFEQWHPAEAVVPPASDSAQAASKPEASAKLRTAEGGNRVYAIGVAVYRSEDGGSTWANLSQYRGASILGAGLADLATSPKDADEVVVAAATGVWRSLDGGMSWTGLNQALPNLPTGKIYGLPAGTQGLRISVTVSNSVELEWQPGETNSWRVTDGSDVTREEAVKDALSRVLNGQIVAIGGSGAYMYAGSTEGQLWVSADRGQTWGTPSERLGAPIESIYVDSRDPRIALASVQTRNPGAKTSRVLHTMNGGVFWDDLTANLPDAAVHGVTADPVSGAVYVATDAGVFATVTDLSGSGRVATWTPISDGLPKAAATDVKLDAGGNQLFAALDGLGVYVAIAPHRLREIHVVNAADYSSRAASPGGLLSVIGARVQSAKTGDESVPILDASDTASQIQVPFNATGTALSLAIEAAAGRWAVGLPLQNASPAIFVNPDGSPWVLDADTGVLLDSSKPARAGSRIQIFATGLGRVTPDWPAGVAAPLTDPPQVRANVHVYLNKIPLQIKQSILAPGYIGSYLVEAEVPNIVNNGPAEMYIEAEGQASNHVRIYVQQ